jgi:flagellar export protein FliJ
MPFRFPLAAVLLVREHAEQREERALKKIQLDLARTSRQIEEVDREMLEAGDARDRAMQQPVLAFELQSYLRQLEDAAEKKKTLLQQLQNLKSDLDLQMKLYQAAHRDREALTDMLQKQRDAYEQDQVREQQKQLDDMFVARRHRN